MSGVPPVIAAWAAKYAVNAVSAVGAALYVVYKRSCEDQKASWGSLHTAMQFFTGLAVVPLLMLFGAAFSDTMAALVMSTNGVILAAAAVVALGALFDDRDP